MRRGKKNKQLIPGTVNARFRYLMDELEKRYPDTTPFASWPPPEIKYLASVDYERERLRGAVRLAKIAMDDWLHSYAPEFCGEDSVKETQARLEAGGTVHYIAVVTEHLTKVLKESENGTV